MFYFLYDIFGMVYTVNRLQLPSNEINVDLIDEANIQGISDKKIGIELNAF